MPEESGGLSLVIIVYQVIEIIEGSNWSKLIKIDHYYSKFFTADQGTSGVIIMDSKLTLLIKIQYDIPAYLFTVIWNKVKTLFI